MQVFSCLIILHVAMLSLTLKTDNYVTKIQHGLEIESHGALKIIDGEWQVLVSLHQPQISPDFEARIVKLQSVLHSAWRNRYVTRKIYYSYMDRLQRLLVIVHSDVIFEKTRYPRSLFDLGGDLLSAVFGVATQKDLKRYKHVLIQLAHSLNSVIYDQNLMTSAINSSREYIIQNRQAINNITLEQTHMNIVLHDIDHQVSIQGRQIRVLTFLEEVNRVITLLQLLAESYMAQVTHFTQQRIALETGYITEAIVARPLMKQLLSQVAAAGYHTIDKLSWLYSNLKLKLVIAEIDTLVYQFTLPLLSKSYFNMYTIRNFPEPSPKSNISFTIEVSGTYAIEDTTGRIIRPHTCSGIEPIICYPGPFFEPKTLPCATSLLTGSISPLKYCSAKITRGQGTSQIYQVAINKYILVTWGERIYHRCHGKLEQSQYETLSAGTYSLVVQPDCTIAGKGWTIIGIARHSISKEIKTRVLNVTGLDFDFDLKEKIIKRLHIQKSTKLLNEISGVSLTNTQALKIDWSKLDNFHWEFVLIGILSALIIITICYIQREKIIAACGCKSNAEPDKSATAESVIEANQQDLEQGPSQRSRPPSVYGASAPPSCEDSASLSSGHSDGQLPHRSISQHMLSEAFRNMRPDISTSHPVMIEMQSMGELPISDRYRTTPTNPFRSQRSINNQSSHSTHVSR